MAIDRNDITELLLNNPELMDKYNYTKEDIDKLSFSSNKNSNEFISFILTVVNIIEDNPDSERVQLKKIFDAFNI